MLVSCTLKDGTVYIPTVAKTKAGFHIAGEPVAVVPVTDADALRRAVREAMAKGNPAISTPTRETFPPSVLPKYTGDRSWSAFMRGVSEWEIYEKDGKYQLTPWVKDPEGSQSWVPDTAHKITFPPGTTVDQVIDRMIAILQAAAR